MYNNYFKAIMKRLFASIVTIALFFSTMGTIKAGGFYQGVSPGSSIIGARIGLSNIVGANVTYDYALAHVWKGAFTIGGQIGYMWKGETTRWVGAKSVWSWNNLDFKLRTTYRLYVLVPEWEVYAGVGLGGGAVIERFESTIKNPADGIPQKTKSTYAFFSGAFILGTSYHFTRNIGLNLEFDFGNWEQSWVNLGVNVVF